MNRTRRGAGKAAAKKEPVESDDTDEPRSSSLFEPSPWADEALGVETAYPPLDVFDLGTIKEDSLTLCVGKRREGKSTLCDQIMYTQRRLFPVAICMTLTKHNGQWTKRIPDPFVHDAYKPDVCLALIRRQQAVIKEGRVDPRVLLLLDDTAAQSQLRFDPLQALDRLAFNGRHLKIQVLITTQRLTRVNVGMRENADLVFIFYSDSTDTLDMIHQNWGADVPKDVFRRMFLETCEGFQCLVINRGTKLKSFGARYFRFTAKLVPDYILGCEEFWASSGENPMAKKRG